MLRVDNAAHLLFIADRHGCDFLRKAAIQFITRDVGTLDKVQATEDFAELHIDSVRALLAGVTVSNPAAVRVCVN